MTVGELRAKLEEVSDKCQLQFVLAGLRFQDTTELWAVRHYPITQDSEGVFLFDLQILCEGYPQDGATCYAQVQLLRPMGYAQRKNKDITEA